MEPARYLLLDPKGNVVAELVDDTIKNAVNRITCIQWRKRNYFYAPWLTNGELVFFQQGGEVVALGGDTIAPRRRKHYSGVQS